MTPVWFPWMIVGGLVFTVLGFIGTKYKDKNYKPVQSLQDFISGSILIAFTGVLAPDLFPEFSFSSHLPVSFSAPPLMDEVDLQVGPPRLIRS